MPDTDRTRDLLGVAALIGEGNLSCLSKKRFW